MGDPYNKLELVSFLSTSKGEGSIPLFLKLFLLLIVMSVVGSNLKIESEAESLCSCQSIMVIG